MKRKGLLSYLTLAVCLLFLILPPQILAQGSWLGVAEQTQAILRQALQAYENGQDKKALEIMDKAYFGPFESQGMEAAIRLSISANRAFEHENMFREIKNSIRQKQPPAVTNRLVTELEAMLKNDAQVLDGKGAGSSRWASFINSFIIIIREGLEAILVIGALTAYMIKSGHQENVRTINLSVILALVASGVTALILRLLLSGSSASQESLEGLTMLLAVAVLFLVSFWLISQAQAKKWQEYIQSKIQQSLSSKSNFALGFAAFLAVYREGAETVLFYQALMASNPSSALPYIIFGFGVGLAALAVIYFIMRLGSVKLPLKPFFAVTGILLYYLAFVFAGQGVKELQAGGLVSITPLPGFPLIGFLGVFPTLETVSVQAALVVLFVGGLALQFWRDKKKTAAVTG